MIDPTQLRRCAPKCPAVCLDVYAHLLSSAMAEAGMTDLLERAAFVAQLAWESGDFQSMIEAADGSAYEGRLDLGNTRPGDGQRYRGRGPIQLTGRDGYRMAGGDLGLPLEETPDMVADPMVGFRVAAWFWRVGAGLRLSSMARERLGRGIDLGEVARRGDLVGVTMAINGKATDGPPSYHRRRVELTVRCLLVLGEQP